MQADIPAADVSLHGAGCCLVAVAEGHAAALHAALAVLTILNAAKQPDRSQASAQLIAAIDSAMDVVMPIVAADVADEMTEQDVAVGLGSAGSLLYFLGQAEDEIANPGRRGPEIQDRFDFAALIADERRGCKQSVSRQIISAPRSIIHPSLAGGFDLAQ